MGKSCTSSSSTYWVPYVRSKDPRLSLDSDADQHPGFTPVHAPLLRVQRCGNVYARIPYNKGGTHFLSCPSVSTLKTCCSPSWATKSGKTLI